MTVEPRSSGMMYMPTEPPTLLRLFTPQFDVTSLVPGLAVVALIAYLLGVRSLRRRGSRWPWHRTATFVAGILTVLLVTATQVMGYGMMLFSIHMLQKMSVTVLAAMLLMLGAPVSLAIRTLPRRGWGAVCRRLLLRALRSRTARVLAHPVVTTVLFVGSLYGIYFTPVFDALMSNPAGHQFMLAHFVVTGLLFFGPIIAQDPWPSTHAHPTRILELVIPVPFHAFFGVAVMMASSLLVDSFANPPASWGIDPVGDQSVAGGIAWSFGELPTVLVLVVVLASWMSSDERRARTLDRAADRSGDAELNAYNARLRAMAEQ